MTPRHEKSLGKAISLPLFPESSVSICDYLWFAFVSFI
jgi:hypothetical protein